MGIKLDFDGREYSELAIAKAWEEFRECLAKGLFGFDEVNKAKETIFLKQYDDLFHKNSGLKYNTVELEDMTTESLGRGTILGEAEKPSYERFLPDKKYIKEDNRFSPPGIEWLYLSIGKADDIYKCTIAECRAKSGQRFGFCNFEIDKKYKKYKLVDLTISDCISYDDINQEFQRKIDKLEKKYINYARILRHTSNNLVFRSEIGKTITQWGVYTYSKLLSEQIFIPLSKSDDKAIVYTPFQTLAQYYISLGYSGIIYKSTVCSGGKNIVLFDKAMAKPIGKIDISILM